MKIIPMSVIEYIKADILLQVDGKPWMTDEDKTVPKMLLQ